MIDLLLLHKKMKKKKFKIKKNNIKSILGIIILFTALYAIYYNSSGATINRECKQIVADKQGNPASVGGKHFLLSICIAEKSL